MLRSRNNLLFIQIIMPKKRHMIALAAMSLASISTAHATETLTYTYDAQGRLTTVDHSGSVNNGAQSAYSFDAADNRVNVTVTGGGSAVIVVPLNGFTVIPIETP